MRLFGLIMSVAIVVGVAWLNYDALIEAFGRGPPYYSRTTNMDKWANPLPWLIVIDLIAAAVIFAILWFTRRQSHLF